MRNPAEKAGGGGRIALHGEIEGRLFGLPRPFLYGVPKICSVNVQEIKRKIRLTSNGIFDSFL